MGARNLRRFLWCDGRRFVVVVVFDFWIIGSARSALAVPADVALSATFDVEEGAVATVWAEVADCLGGAAWQQNHRSRTFRRVLRPRCAASGRLADGDAHAHGGWALSTELVHVLTQATGDGVGQARHALLPETALLPATDALELRDDLVEPLGR